MQTWMRIAGIVLLLTGCSLQMEAPRESVALFEARPAVPSLGDVAPVPIEDPLVIPSADFEKMQAYHYVCVQVSGADGKFGTPVQEMGSEQTSGSVTALFSKFTIPKLWVGRKYSIRVFGFKNRTEVCPFDFKGVSDFAQLGVLDTFVVPDKPSEVIIPVNFWESSEVPPNPPPVSPVINSVTISPLSNDVTPGQSVTFQATASVTSPVALTYTWYKGTGSNPSVCPSTATPVHTSTGSAASYTTPPADTDVSAGTRIYYCVIASALGVSSKESAWAQVDVSSAGPLPNTQEVNFLTPAAVATGNGITVSWSTLPTEYQTLVSWIQGSDQNMNEPIGCSAGNFTSAISSHIHTGVEPGKWYRYRICTQNGTTVSPGVVTPAVQAIPSFNPECNDDLYSGNFQVNHECPGPDGVLMIFTQNSSGFKYWKEKNGTRVLNATGLVVNGWQKKLNRKGDDFLNNNDASDYLTDPTTIAGRACPQNVFLNYGTMTATNRCVYYDSGTPQSLDHESGTLGEDHLGGWDQDTSGAGAAASYYEGNVKTCANKGMRLPTLYETQINSPGSSNLPDGDDGISPAFSPTSGVPTINSGISMWTASAFNESETGYSNYWTYDGSPTDTGNNFGNSQPYVRCVLPSH